ncbi:N-acetyltransferase [Compostibacillus humi]|uniref:N-acetyltransferase n=1 Tax=Compostibacillus humi TaxID=1245525 RepID=A0A8J2XA98_9BACI|nr:GNAT family N-acetyltransferase [Compostibacillus humi]GFZ88389.1 N-acetyltransferase [Compostibacillus humi]
MELQTERLKLIPCTEESAAAAALNNYELGPHIKMYLAELKSDPTLLGWGVWFVIDKDTNTVIGDIGFKGKPNMEKTVEIGYGIKSSARNKGYATEAVKEIIAWAFSSDEVATVIAECREDNYPSMKVLEKLNMEQTGKEGHKLRWQICKEKRDVPN